MSLPSNAFNTAIGVVFTKVAGVATVHVMQFLALGWEVANFYATT